MKARANFFRSKSLKKFLLSMSVLMFFTANFLAAQSEFDPANPDKSEKAVKSLVNAKIDDLKKHGVKKIIIFGCKGDFVLARETESQTKVLETDYATLVQHRTIVDVSSTLNQIYCIQITTRLLDSVVTMFNNAGIEVVPVKTWQQHQIYQEMLKLMIENDIDENKKYQAFIKSSTTTTTISVPALDYRIEPEKVFKLIKYTKLKTQDRGKMLDDFGAQAFCDISFSIDGLTQRPNITGLTLWFETGMKKYDMGTKDTDGNKVYMYSMTSNPILNIKNVIKYHTATLSESKKTVDVKKFDQAILEMQSYILSLFQDKLTLVMKND